MGKENRRTFQVENKFGKIRKIGSLKNNIEVFLLQMKMNLMYGRLVLIKMLLTNNQYLLNGFYGLKHCAKCIIWINSCNPFFKTGRDILKGFTFTLELLGNGN